MIDKLEAFRITEPSGKTYRVFADGHVEGFERGAVIDNRIPALIASAESKRGDEVARFYCALVERFRDGSVILRVGINANPAKS